MEYFNVSIMEKKMDLNICQLCAVDFTVEKFLTSLIDGLVYEGCDVTIVCSDGPYITRLINRGYKIKTIPISRGLNPYKAIRSIILLYKFFKKNKFDIIHVHTPTASFFARIASKLASQSYIIYTVHGFYFHDNMPKFKRYIFVTLEKFVGKFTDLIFSQSNEDTLTAIKENIIHRENIYTIGNGINIEKFNYDKIHPNHNKIRKELNIPIHAKVIGIVARMVKEKGYIEFLAAVQKLYFIQSDFYVVIIGDKLNSDYDQGISNEIQQAKNILGDNLILLGIRDDVPNLISIMDLFCLPSHREGMPRTIIEAMLLKKPVIATNIRGCRELVIDKKTGLLVPANDIEKLTNSMKYLLNNLDIAKQMGEMGFQIAKDLYNEKMIVKLQIDIIKKRFNKFI